MAQHCLYPSFFWVLDNTFYRIQSAYLSYVDFTDWISKIDKRVAYEHACNVTFDSDRLF